MTSDYESRIRHLEMRVSDLLRRLANDESQIGALALGQASGRQSALNATPGGTSAIFFTTSAITAATVSGSGLTSVLTYGSGTARHCVTNGTGQSKPDTTASDITIYSPLNGSSIPTAQFVDCDLCDDGSWLVVVAWC
jgi:hypothetical protein